MSVEILNIDCMEYMRDLPDNAFDLAIVDPPYGINQPQMNMGSRQTVRPTNKAWDVQPPSDAYFTEIKRISKNQIVWGGNYYSQVWPTRCFVCWDKGETMQGRSFAECEIAATSFDKSAKLYKKNPQDLFRIHPTQKPVAIYQYLLEVFSNFGERIIDTHLGSGSSAIAAHYFGCDFVGCEIDEDYYYAALKRFENETKQLAMF